MVVLPHTSRLLLHSLLSLLPLGGRAWSTSPVTQYSLLSEFRWFWQFGHVRVVFWGLLGWVVLVVMRVLVEAFAQMQGVGQWLWWWLWFWKWW